jgi:hypothetical protein
VPVLFWFSVGNVQFVNVPEDGVPNTPPLTSGAPAVPTLTAKAVATPVPRPEIPVDTGSPVQLVKVPDEGVPNTGVTNVGLVDNTVLPVPVEVVTPVPPRATERVPVVPATIGKFVALVNVPDDGVPRTPPLTTGAPAVPTATANAVATPVPRPDTPVPMGRPVAFVNVPEVGVPKIGVTNVGLVANTFAPVPVSSVSAAAKLAEDGVAKNVATPVPKPDTPVEIGKPVAFVRVPDVGVPRIGVTNVGLVANTLAPVPVSSVNAAAKLADDGVAKNVATPVPSPEIPVATGRPVAFVKVPEAGVPSTGAVSVGLAMVGEIR